MQENQKSTNIEVKKNNRNQVFRYICRYGRVSNPDIAYGLKLSLPTVMQSTKELLSRGLIEDAGIMQSTGGRRARALTAAANSRLAVGLDITKNHIGLLLINLLGEILRYERQTVPFEPDEQYYRKIGQLADRFVRENNPGQGIVLGIGISFPGIINSDREEISYSHALGIHSLSLHEIGRFFSYPCSFLNDGNAGAYGEGIQSEQPSRFFYLSLSNTVGGAVFEGGTLVQGTNFRCGEVGHMTIVPDGKLCYCGKAGCLDGYCSAEALSKSVVGTLEQFFQLLAQKNPDAESIWEGYTRYLAIALNNIHMVLDCDIVLGGYVGSYLEPYLPEIRKKVSERNTFGEDGTFVRCCQYQVEAAALGAARFVIETFMQEV